MPRKCGVCKSIYHDRRTCPDKPFKEPVKKPVKPVKYVYNAVYHVTEEFVIPPEIAERLYNEHGDFNTGWKIGTKYNTLYIYEPDGTEHSIQPDWNAPVHFDWKYARKWSVTKKTLKPCEWSDEPVTDTEEIIDAGND